MQSLLAYIFIVLSVLLLVVSLLIRKDFERAGGICAVVAIILLVIAICMLAFTGAAPHIVEDQYMPVSYP